MHTLERACNECGTLFLTAEAELAPDQRLWFCSPKCDALHERKHCSHFKRISHYVQKGVDVCCTCGAFLQSDNTTNASSL